MMPLLLAAVLAFSAVAKLRDRPATLSAIGLLRLPRFLRQPWVAVALPAGELALAAALLLPWTPAVVAAAGATLVLMVTYWGVIARAMTFDPRPSCGCFGRIGDQSVSERTLVRNTLLVAAAVAALWWSLAGHTVPTTLAAFGAAQWWWLVALLLVAAVAVLILGGGAGASAQPPQAPYFPEQPAAQDVAAEEEGYVRAPIPAAVLQSPEGDNRLLVELARERAQLLIFYTCGCTPAAETDALVPEWRRRLPALDIRSVVTFPAAPDSFTEPVWLDHGALAYQAFGMFGHPCAVLLGADGWLAGGPVAGLEQLAEFVDEIEAVLTGAVLPQPEDAMTPAAAEGPAQTL